MTAHFPKIQLYLFIFFMTILAFLLSLSFSSVFTYRLRITPRRKHQLMQLSVGNRKYMIDDATIIDIANRLLTYYFNASKALLTNKAPPAALHPNTVSRR